MWIQEPLIPKSMFHGEKGPCGLNGCTVPAVWVYTSEGTAHMNHADGIPAHDWEPLEYTRKWWQVWEPKKRDNPRWLTREWIPPYG